MSFSIVFERLQAAKSVLCSEIGCKITNFFRNTLSVRSEKRHARFLRAAPHMGVTFSKRHALDGFYCRKCIVTCNPWAISHKFWAEKINLRLTQHVELAESCLQTFAYQCLFAFCAKDGATFILHRAQLKWSCRARGLENLASISDTLALPDSHFPYPYISSIERPISFTSLYFANSLFMVSNFSFK